jgi:hypothetical protein
MDKTRSGKTGSSRLFLLFLSAYRVLTQRTTLLVGILCFSVLGGLTAYAAVNLEYFSGAWQGDRVILEFGTEQESDHAAFHVWRSTANVPPEAVNASNAVRVTDEPIIAQYACYVGSGDYIYIDDTVEADEDVYYYYLESFNCGPGGPEIYGAIEQENSGLSVLNPKVPPNLKTYLPTIGQGTSASR